MMREGCIDSADGGTALRWGGGGGVIKIGERLHFEVCMCGKMFLLGWK